MNSILSKMLSPTSALALFSLVLTALPLRCAEYPAGKPLIMNDIEIAAIYMLPVEMEPRGMGLPADKADAHFQADIRATKGNKNGFGRGEWVPYLTITYTLTNTDTGKSASGMFMPMIGKDGPHYGDNVKMPGVGNYKLTLHVEPPSKGGMHRHTDKETGVGRWWEPFDAAYTFKYTGLK